MRRMLLLPVLAMGSLLLLVAEVTPLGAAGRPNYGNNQRYNRNQNKGADITLTVAPDDTVKVRLHDLPDNNAFDDKGNPKVLSASEKQKAKGDTPAEQRLPGYKGTMADLKPGDIVQVTLSTPKPDPKDKEKTKYVASNLPAISGTVKSANSGQLVLHIPGLSSAALGGQQGGNGDGGIFKNKHATLIVVQKSAAGQGNQGNQPPAKGKKAANNN